MADHETPANKGAGSDEQASVKQTAAKKKTSPQKKTTPRKQAAPRKKAAPKKKTIAKKKPVPKRQAEQETVAKAAANQAKTPKFRPDETQQAPVAEGKEAVTSAPTTTAVASTKKKRMALWPWAMLLALGGAAVYLLNDPPSTEIQATDQSPDSAAANNNTQSITPVTVDESSAPAIASTDTATQAEAEQIGPAPETTQTDSTGSLAMPSTPAPDSTVSEGVTPTTEDTKSAETPEIISMESPPAPGAEESPNPQLVIDNLETESREINPGAEDTAIEPSTDKASVTAVESGPGEEQAGTATPETASPEEQAQEQPLPKSTNGAYTPKRMEPPNTWQARRQYRTPYNYRPDYSHPGPYPYGYDYGRRAPYPVYNPYLRRWDTLKDRDKEPVELR